MPTIEAGDVIKRGQCSDVAFRFPYVFTRVRRDRGADDFRRDISDLRDGETLRIATGSANWKVFNEAEGALSAAHAGKRVAIKVIVGPVLSVDDQMNNALIGLAEKDVIELYRVPWYPAPHHYRVYGQRKAWIESHHQPLEAFDQRRVTYATGPDRVNGCIEEFNRGLGFWKFRRSNSPKEDFALLTDKDYARLLTLTAKMKIQTDYLKAAEIRGLLEHEGESSNLTPDRLHLLRVSY